jgi:delta 1-pyrroline-5-carboxylate dehydrogenase
VRLRDAMSPALTALKAWADSHQFSSLSALCTQFAAQSQSGITRLLAGPTGERNSYAILPREHVLCLADVEGDLLTQLAAVLAVGGSAVWPEAELTKALFARLPKDIQARSSVWPTGTRTKWCSMRSCITAIPTSCARSASKWPSVPGDRRRTGLVPGRDNDCAGTPGDRAGLERQHRGGGR